MLFVRSFTEVFYQNENLWFGHVGHFLIILAFVASCFGFISGLNYALDHSESNLSWKKATDWLYRIQFVAIVLVFSLLIVMFYTHQWEYHYIWRHSSSDLPWYFILSAFWEGQEGSFLLWILWNGLLGLYFVNKKDRLSVGVLAIMALIQAALYSMVLGVDLGGKLIGSDPFILLRNEMDIPILSRPDYLTLIKDGNGLNILLQNYWMVIHPPVLFLGFASVSIPFAYAVASLLHKDYTSWIPEVKSWSLFSLGILGMGILMGGRWAYEALSFGGFWAWDPVENASFVPWLLMLAGVHTLIIFNATKQSLKATYFFFILSFGFILYSTFLTRSGILGDSSVHSFTDLGMTGQLLIFMGIFVVGALLLLSYNMSKIPDTGEEEKVNSREFWMFIGVLIVFVSSLQITFSTSIPVWNKVFGLKMAPPANANAHYNNIQIWLAIVVVLLMGMTPLITYFETKRSIWLRKVLTFFIGGVILASAMMYFSNIPFVQKYKVGLEDKNIIFQFLSAYYLLYIACMSSILMSFKFVYDRMKTMSWLQYGGVIAHLGFAIFILGALLSQYQKTNISYNLAGINFGKEFNNEEQMSNTMLIKGRKEMMESYATYYLGSLETKQGAQYRVRFEDSKNPNDSFTLMPEAKFIKEGENTRIQAEPSIKHLWNKDIFTHITSVPDLKEAENKSQSIPAKLHDTISTSRYLVYFDRVVPKKMTDLIEVDIKLKILSASIVVDSMTLNYQINSRTGQILNNSQSTKDGELTIAIEKITPETGEFVFSVYEKNPNNDWIIMKAIVFPYINVLWLGCILLILGTLLSSYARRKRNK
jgi:cytochrome c-type biogenesis protein CcmF